MRTSLRIAEGRRTWHVEHFAAHRAGVNEELRSPIFELAGRKWRLELYPGGDSDQTKDQVAVYLANTEDTIVRAQFGISFRDEDVQCDKEVREFGQWRRTWGYKKICDRGTVLSMLKDGTLDVHLAVRVYGELTEDLAIKKVDACTTSTLCDSLRELLASGDKADVTFHASGAVLPAHSLVVGMRSPVLKAMFSSDMKEGTTKSVELPTDEVTARAFLTFLYTDHADLSCQNNCCHLLKLAHQYEVTSLVNMCVTQLRNDISVLSPESAVERLLLADELGLLDLKKECCQYLVWPSRLPVAQATEPWERLAATRPHLAVELLQCICPPARRKRPREEKDWQQLTLAALRSECHHRGISSSGTKAQIASRLQRHSTEGSTAGGSLSNGAQQPPSRSNGIPQPPSRSSVTL